MIWLVALAGGVGALARAGVDRLVTISYPGWAATLAVNVTGSFLIGVSAAHLSGPAAGIVGTGFCGGLTTFSSACWQTARELGAKRIPFAVVYTGATIAGCLLAVSLGLATGR